MWRMHKLNHMHDNLNTENSKQGVDNVTKMRPLLESEEPVDALHQADNDGLPGDQVADPVEQRAEEQVRLLPRRVEQVLQVDLLVAVRTRLLLADHTPAAYAELVEAARAIKSTHVPTVSNRLKSISQTCKLKKWRWDPFLDSARVIARQSERALGLERVR